MARSDLTSDHAEDLLAGRPVPGRAFLRPVVELTVFLRASGAGEPAPPMSADLVSQIAAGAGPAERLAGAGVVRHCV